MKRKSVLYLLMLALALITTPAMGAQSCTANARISPANQTVPETTNGSPTQVTLNGSPSSPQQGISYSWIQTGGPAVTLSNPTAAKPTFSAPSVGPVGATLTFSLTVTGCSPVQTSSATTAINVTNVLTNSPPVASAVVSPASVYEGSLVTLDGSSSSDPDGNPLTYAWTQISGPTVTLSSSGAIATFIAPNAAYPNGSSLTFTLTVSDGTLTGTTDKIINVLWVNDPPVASLLCPASVNENAPVNLASTSTDPDDGIASQVWSQLSGVPNADLSGVDLSSSAINFAAPLLTSQYNTMKFGLTVTDHGGLNGSAECDITVLDITPPAFNGTADINAEATSASGAVVNFNLTATDNVDGNVEINCIPASGATFALGTADVTCSASDKAGNRGTAGFKITVQDTTPPAIIGVPSDMTIEAIGPSGAAVSYTNPTAIDLVDGPVTVNCAPKSGSTFGLGVTLVTCSATDSHSNSTTKSFKITVRDTTPPALSLPSAIGPVEGNTLRGATVDYIASANDLVDGTVSVSCDKASGSIFPLGTTEVNCSAKDAAGNAASASFKVTVVDTTPPEITNLPVNTTAIATSVLGAPVAYNGPVANDIVDGSVAVACTPSSGSNFAIGTTMVTCNAADNSGNTRTKNFSVTVKYGFIGPLSPYDPGKAYKIKSAIPIKWQYTSNTGAVLPSSTAKPRVIISKVADSITITEDAIALDDAGSSGYQYDTTTNTWQYNWKTTGLTSGTYYIYIRSDVTGQLDCPYPAQLVK